MEEKKKIRTNVMNDNDYLMNKTVIDSLLNEYRQDGQLKMEL